MKTSQEWDKFFAERYNVKNHPEWATRPETDILADMVDHIQKDARIDLEAENQMLKAQNVKLDAELKRVDFLHQAQYEELKDTKDKLLVQRKLLETIAALTKERDELKAELVRWSKSFDGHVYVPNEEYAALVKERDAWKEQALHGVR